MTYYIVGFWRHDPPSISDRRFLNVGDTILVTSEIGAFSKELVDFLDQLLVGLFPRVLVNLFHQVMRHDSLHLSIAPGPAC